MYNDEEKSSNDSELDQDVLQLLVPYINGLNDKFTIVNDVYKFILNAQKHQNLHGLQRYTEEFVYAIKNYLDFINKIFSQIPDDKLGSQITKKLSENISSKHLWSFTDNLTHFNSILTQELLILPEVGQGEESTYKNQITKGLDFIEKLQEQINKFDFALQNQEGALSLKSCAVKFDLKAFPPRQYDDSQIAEVESRMISLDLNLRQRTFRVPQHNRDIIKALAVIYMNIFKIWPMPDEVKNTHYQISEDVNAIKNYLFQSVLFEFDENNPESSLEKIKLLRSDGIQKAFAVISETLPEEINTRVEIIEESILENINNSEAQPSSSRNKKPRLK